MGEEKSGKREKGKDGAKESDEGEEQPLEGRAGRGRRKGSAHPVAGEYSPRRERESPLLRPDNHPYYNTYTHLSIISHSNTTEILIFVRDASQPISENLDEANSRCQAGTTPGGGLRYPRMLHWSLPEKSFGHNDESARVLSSTRSQPVKAYNASCRPPLGAASACTNCKQFAFFSHELIGVPINTDFAEVVNLKVPRALRIKGYSASKVEG